CATDSRSEDPSAVALISSARQDRLDRRTVEGGVRAYRLPQGAETSKAGRRSTQTLAPERTQTPRHLGTALTLKEPRRDFVAVPAPRYKRERGCAAAVEQKEPRVVGARCLKLNRSILDDRVPAE